MNFLPLMLTHWRECLIAILAGTCFFAVRSCEVAKEKLIEIKAEDRALAQDAQTKAAEQQRKDKEEYENAQQDFKNQLDKLSADHRVATIKCVRNNESGRSEVPRAAAATDGASPEARADVPREATFDPGPALDELARECDKLAVEHNNLSDWVISTR